MKPEEKARVLIDQMFADAGWKVVSRDEYSPNLSAAAIEEGILEGGKEADYLLFINGKAVGVLEAKKASVDVSSEKVVSQAEGYTHKLTKYYQFYANPLPIVYTSNGQVTLFRDMRDPDCGYIPVGCIHTPKEICNMLGIEDEFAGLPTLKKKGLRDCQFEAITELEKSFRSGQNRAYMVLATGAGKTYTACMASYRFLSYTPMRRVLFLVDRNNLGKQAEDEFGKFKLTETGDPFNSIFTVNRLKGQTIPKDSNVVISTIQRLFSLLKGEEVEDTDDDENYDGDETPTPAVTLPDNPTLPKDFFDLIIVDECHRSIYGSWRSVLEYFSSARIIGLTATPAPETKAFFNNNRVINYTLERSIADGVNVDYRVYRIKTKATEDGGAIRDGEDLMQITRYTGKVENVKNSGEKTYTGNELNRSIVNPSQIKLVLETYRDAVYTEMFNDPQREPNMDYLPKTLIFALNASNIVQIAKEVFGKENDPQFVQKITYSAGNSNELIRHFRNDKEFRIAVTVTLVATGTDVKPIEVVMFMRDIESESLYTQMKGRGVRTIGDEQLRIVTPNAFSKDLFYLVDAVGVTEHEMIVTRPGTDPRPATMSLKELLERITHGYVDDEYLKILAGRLSRIYNKADEEQRTKFANLAGKDMKEIASSIYEALESGTLPPFVDINEPNNERKGLVSALANHPEARNYLLILNAGFVKILVTGEDELVSKGFSIEEAAKTTAAFEKYVEAHKDEIEALRIIYNNQGDPITYAMLKELDSQLRFANAKFNPALLWNTYALLHPTDVVKFTTKDEKDAITNIIQLVRFAFKHIPKLESLKGGAAKYFNLWCGQTWRGVTETQKALLEQVVNYIVTNGSCTIDDIKEEDKTQAGQLIQAFGSLPQANMVLASLSQFMIYRKTA